MKLFFYLIFSFIFLNLSGQEVFKLDKTGLQKDENATLFNDTINEWNLDLSNGYKLKR